MVHCGHVYFLWFGLAGKEKLLVPAFIRPDGRVRFFVINTARTEYQATNEGVAKYVIPLPLAGNENFLVHDSWLACHEIFGGWTIEQIDAAQGCYRGPLDAATLGSVRVLIQESRIHSEADKAAILAQWP